MTTQQTNAEQFFRLPVNAIRDDQALPRRLTQQLRWIRQQCDKPQANAAQRISVCGILVSLAGILVQCARTIAFVRYAWTAVFLVAMLFGPSVYATDDPTDDKAASRQSTEQSSAPSAAQNPSQNSTQKPNNDIPSISAALPEHVSYPQTLSDRFAADVTPLFHTYCVSCHGKDKPEAELDLTRYDSLANLASDQRRWIGILERLQAGDMPPATAKLHPTPTERRKALECFEALRGFEIRRNAGDPGVVLARRLSNAELNYTVRDLTGIDIQPTREFPIDPANTAGFDNSGESLVMSPNLLNKYLKAAHEIASHMFLRRDGIAFAPHSMLTSSDQEKYCVHRIIDFYHQHNIELADYFLAAWRFKHRRELGLLYGSLQDAALANKVSVPYLKTLWDILEIEEHSVGPLAKLQTQWKGLPAPSEGQADLAKQGCEQMREYVVQVRKKVEMRFFNITAGRMNTAAQPLLVWKNVQYATHRRKFDSRQLQNEGEPVLDESTVVEPGIENEFGPGKTQIVKNLPGDPDLFVPAGQRDIYEVAFAKFCSIFPDKFYMEERGRNYFDTTIDRGRYLNAGFHSLMGYFRDDQPLYELLLDEEQQKTLDEMWFELDFIAAVNARMYIEYYSGASSRQLRGAAAASDKPNDAATMQEHEITSEVRLRQFEKQLLTQASGGDERGIAAIQQYIQFINDNVRSMEKAHRESEPRHLDSLLDFARRAYRRPLTLVEKRDIVDYYRRCREQDKIDHLSAIRESLVGILLSPDFLYRIDLIDAGRGIQPLSDYELASRLSYFLWSSMPDEELINVAARGALHNPEVIRAQAHRMLKDQRIRALAVEFGSSWLDVQRFDEINTVDRERFPAFTNDLRQAMYEEPIRFMTDVFQSNRSVLDFLYAHDTFANAAIAKHYGLPITTNNANDWVAVPNANEYGRGGLLSMAAFMTKNAPGLRTSPVKRGNWVVKNLLGEQVPLPPPNVPELPKDEAKLDLPLREMLARHRDDAACSSCHSRIDAFGLVFEGFGPIGEVRERDLAGRAIDVSATFPDGTDGVGIPGLQKYIHDHRQTEFVDNLTGKLLAFALGRSLILSDEEWIQATRSKLEKGDYRFDVIVESIVTSSQFLNKRGPQNLVQR